MSVDEIDVNVDRDYKTRFRKRSILWALCNEDFSDLTIEQIAEVFDKTPLDVRNYMNKIKKQTGFVVPYKKVR